MRGPTGTVADCRSGDADTETGLLSRQLGNALVPEFGAEVQITNLRRLAGGASYETWAFDAVTTGDDVRVHELVVRRKLEQSVLQLELHREFELLRVLHAHGVRVARPLVHTDLDPADKAFMIAERVPGTDVRKHLARTGVTDRRALVPHQGRLAL